jgi:cell division protein FtsB
MQIDLWKLKQRIKPTIVPAVLGLVLVYTADQLFTGERGIVTWRVMQTQLAQLHGDIDELNADINSLNTRIARLKPTQDGKGRLHVDDDYLDQLAREDLSLIKPGEAVIITSPSALGQGF